MKNSKAFRVQLVDDLMITAYKKKGKNIDKLFGDTYEWYVPYTTKSGRAGITMLQKVNGKYQWMSESDDGEIGQTVLYKEKVASVVAKYDICKMCKRKLYDTFCRCTGCV